MPGKLRLAPYYTIFDPAILKEDCMEEEESTMSCPPLKNESPETAETDMCMYPTKETETYTAPMSEASTCIINEPISYVSEIEYTETTAENCCHTKTSLELLRSSIVEEIMAIASYEEIIQKATDYRVKQAVCHISNDERAHMADQLSLLNKYDRIQSQQFKNIGWDANKNRLRHNINGQNPKQMLIHLQTHLLEELELIIIDYLDTNLPNVLTGCHCLPKHLQCFTQQHQPIEDYLDCIPQPIMEQFAKFFLQIIPEAFICQYKQAMQEKANEILTRIAEEHNCPALLNQAGNQILCNLQNYLMDYLLTESIVKCSQSSNSFIIEEKAFEAPEEAAAMPENEAPAPEDKMAEEKNNGQYPAIDASADQCSSVPAWIQLIQKALTDELNAVNFYNRSIAEVEEEDIKHSFCGAMNIEKEHVATLTQILRHYDNSLKKELSLHGWTK